MADDGWWSDVTHHDDELTLERRPWTPPVDPSVHDAPTVLDAAAVRDPIVLPVAVDGTAAWSLFESAGQAQPAPAPPPAPAPAPSPAATPSASDDDEVPFWLLPPPPRPGMPPPQAAAPAQRVGPQFHAPQQAAPHPLLRQRTRPGQPATRRDRNRPAATLSAADRARELLDRATTAAGPLMERVRTAPPVMLVAAAAFGVGVVVVLATLLSFGGDKPAPGAENDTSITQPTDAAPVAVDRTTVTAEASSEQDADGDVSYGAANTLDGKVTTAWNSDGKGPGTTLTYTFDAPVDLRSVTLTNGYQKTSLVKGKKTDLYAANSRVRQVKIVTDGGSWTWSVQDSRAPQTLRKTFGTTKTLTLEVVSVYKGDKYSDTAISEVSFTAAG